MVVVGAAGYMRLGVDRVPSVDLPTLFIRTTLARAAPETIESDVSQRIEEVVNTVEGLDELRSISSQGQSFVIATFKLNRNIDVAAQDVRDRVNSVSEKSAGRDRPAGGAEAQQRRRPGDVDRDLRASAAKRELTEFAERIVKEKLERSTGVGEVLVNGGIRRAINVWVDPDKLVAYNLPITAVRDAIVRQNADIPGGNVTGPRARAAAPHDGKDRRSRRRSTTWSSPTLNGQPIRVRDVGYAEDGTQGAAVGRAAMEDDPTTAKTPPRSRPLRSRSSANRARTRSK